MKILLIWWTAHIWPHLLQELLTGDDYEVATLTRTGKSYLTETAFSGDRNNKEDLQKVLSDFQPEVIVDMIPFTKEQAETLSLAINEYNRETHLIALSSIDIYSAYAKIHMTEDVPYQKCPIKEEDVLRKQLGTEWEKYNKLEVENTYMSQLENVTIIRVPATYGFPDTTRINEYLIPMVEWQKEIQVSQTRLWWKFSRAYTKNIAWWIFLLVEKHQEGKHIYNIAEQKAYTERQWIEKIAEICWWNWGIIEWPDDEKIDLKQDFYVSSEKIRKELWYTEKYDSDIWLEQSIFFSLYKYHWKDYSKYY